MDYLQTLSNFFSSSEEGLKNLFGINNIDQVVYLLPSLDDVIRAKLVNSEIERHIQEYVDRVINRKYYKTYRLASHWFQFLNTQLTSALDNPLIKSTKPCYVFSMIQLSDLRKFSRGNQVIFPGFLGTHLDLNWIVERSQEEIVSKTTKSDTEDRGCMLMISVPIGTPFLYASSHIYNGEMIPGYFVFPKRSVLTIESEEYQDLTYQMKGLIYEETKRILVIRLRLTSQN